MALMSKFETKTIFLLGDITTDFNRFTQLNQIYIEAENGTITMDGTIIARGNDVNDDNPNTFEAIGKVFLRASDGAFQTIRGRIHFR